MARFINLWHVNPSAQWPTDPSKLLEMEEMMWAMMDGLKKKGEIEEWGVFPDPHCGYIIGRGETADVFRNSSMFYPYIVSEIHEIIPHEKEIEIIRAIRKAQIAAMKK
jgi:hypothetical protein